MIDLLLASLVRATPLLITGLAVALAFRAGIWNIGAEGQLLAGAVAATWLGTHWTAPHYPGVVVMFAVAALAGALWAAVPALLRRKFGVLEVITTIMLNFIAEQLVGYLVHGPMQEAGHTYPQSDPIAGHFELSPMVEGARLTVMFPAGMLLAIGLWFFLLRTRPGFALRAAGTNPRAAEVSGRIPVAQVTATAFLASGAIAGVAGAAEVSGVTFALYEKLSPGYGYTAIAVALLARLNPLAVIPSAILFGFLEAGASALQRSAGVPSVTVYAVEGIIILLVVLASNRKSDA